MKRLGNKGMVIELVIITTVVVFALCTIMTLYSVNALNYNDFAKNRIENKLFLDSIGDKYLAYLNYKGSFDDYEYDFDNGSSKVHYTIDVTNDNDGVILKIKEGRSISLIIEYKKDVNGKYKISRWSYGE